MNFPGSKLPPPWRGFDHLYKTVFEECVANGCNSLMLVRKGAGALALIDSLPPAAEGSPRSVRVAGFSVLHHGLSASIKVITETPEEDWHPLVRIGKGVIIERRPDDRVPIIDYLVGDATHLGEVGKLPASDVLNHAAALVYGLSDWKRPEVPEPIEFVQP